MTRMLAALAAALTTAVLTAAVVIPATPTFAQSQLGDTQVVRHLDLDLGSKEGMRTLRHRVEAAITSICGDKSSVSLGARNAVGRCQASARAEAAPQIARVAYRSRRASVLVSDHIDAGR